MNYLETLKNITKNKERRTQNLILIVVLLVILLIAINYIFSDKNSSNSTSNKSNIINSDNTNVNNDEMSQEINLEQKLADILSKISGISDVSVVLSYSKDTTQNIVYNTKQTEDGEKLSSEKSVAYNEDGSKKTAIVESVEMPKIEGAIVVAKGANTVDMKSKLASAVSTVTALPVYKVQVFEKEE